VSRATKVSSLLSTTRQAITPTRLRSYPTVSSSGREDVVAYWLDVSIAQSLYPLLHATEIMLRNSIDRYVRASSGWTFAQTPFSSWMLNPKNFRTSAGMRYVKEAMSKIGYTLDQNTSIGTLNQGGKPGNHDDLVAATSFGFWTSLATGSYNYAQPRSPHLWPTGLSQVFPHSPFKRIAPISTRLSDIRRLRNRVFHYEPIHRLPVRAVRQSMLELVWYISPDIGQSLRNADPSQWTLQPGWQRDVEAALLLSCA
jgi:hypothetical protein